MSKDINVSYEDLVFGAFTALLLTNSDDESLTYEQLNDYETAIVEYCVKNKIRILMDTTLEAKTKFRDEHDEFLFDDHKILLANLGKWLQKKNASLDLDEATIFLNGSVIKPLIKKKTLSYR